MISRNRPSVIKLDQYEYGIIFNSLNNERNKLLKDSKPTEAIDDVLLKLINAKRKDYGEYEKTAR